MSDSKNRFAAQALDQGRFDVVVVGAGFAGLYMLYRLRALGLRARVYEAGSDVGGTWYWNRYPGARCDAESLAYSFSFSPELEQEWSWTERYATQPEILAYARHVAERFDLKRDIRFRRRVTAVHYDDATACWSVATAEGDRATAQLLVMATGCLSVPQVPVIPGLDDFAGPCYQAGAWPHEPVSFAGQRVGVIGTGSSAIQAIPVIAAEAAQLTVFQRTANFSVPAANAPLDPTWVQQFKKNYRKHRDHHKRGLGQGFGDLDIEPRPGGPVLESGAGTSAEEIYALLEVYWQRGGARFMGVIGDTLLNAETNEVVAEFVRDKIREIVKDPATAEVLCPQSHPIGSKRICVDTGYFETFNRPNVSLVDLRDTPIEGITPTGVATTAQHYELDALVLATGFDAMTGALLRMDIRGAGGQRLADKWHAGPCSYLGLAIAGFPNLFTITGPGSPSVLSNVLVSIEQHVDWIIACLEHMRAHSYTHIEAEQGAEEAWVSHVNRIANATLFPKGGSWYLGANVPGKPRVFMPYAGGVGAYRTHCEGVVARGYEGFKFARRKIPAAV